MPKRAHPHVDEDTLVLQAIRNSKLSMFVPQDAILFQAILSDVFSDGKLPISDNQRLRESVIKSCKKKNLQPTDIFLEKVQQVSA